jgi:hypothetical protein
MTTAQQITRSIPTAAEARVSLLAKTVRRAASAAKRDGRPYYVVPTYTRICIERDEPKFGAYWTVYADRAERGIA